jgi:predicted DNA-binding antitoxin AbrB/MazE fold protein
METERVVIPGLVKNGLVVPLGPVLLPEGAQVEIVIPSLSSELTPELRTEFDAWERVSDEAWALIDQWEREEQP